MNKGLLLVAHGSRREASNQEIKDLTMAIRAAAKPRYSIVEYAFLELAEPSIAEGIEQCIQNGAYEIFVLPYLLSAGRHVTRDIPTQVDCSQQEHPGARIRILPHIGAFAGMATLVLSQAP